MPCKPYGSGKHKGYSVQFRAIDPTGEEHRIRKRLRGVSKNAAEAWERKVKDGIVSGTIKPIRGDVPDGAPLFRTFVEDFLRTYPASADNKPSEVAQKKSICEHHLTPAFGDLPLDSQDWPKRIARFKADQLAGLGPTETKLERKTVNNELTVLNRIFNYAVETHVIAVAPRIKLLKTEKREMPFYEHEAVTDLLREAKVEGRMWHAMVLFAVSTGLRLGELEALEWRDVDMKRKRVTVSRSVWKGIVGTPKNGHFRVVELTDEAIEAIKGLGHARPRIFSRDDGGPMNAAIAEKAMARICSRAKLPRAGWHILRHTAITWWVRAGIDFKTVQVWAGHASINQTMAYAHHAPDQSRRNPLSFGQPVANADTVPANVLEIQRKKVESKGIEP